MNTGKAIKKPIPVEFIKVEESHLFQVHVFITGKSPYEHFNTIACDRWDEYVDIVKKQGYYDMKTLESGQGTQNANIGDYILKGIDGECWPIKADIFERTYDTITEN